MTKKRPPTLTTDFDNETIASLLEYLRRIAHDGLPLDSIIATGLKTELARRGVPAHLTDSLIECAKRVEQAGAKMRFSEEPGKVVAAVVIVIR